MIVDADPTRINFFLALVKATFNLFQSLKSCPILASVLDRTSEMIMQSASRPWNLSTVENRTSLGARSSSESKRS